MLRLSIGSCMLRLRLSIGSCMLRLRPSIGSCMLRLRLSFRGSGFYISQANTYYVMLG